MIQHRMQRWIKYFLALALITVVALGGDYEEGLKAAQKRHFKKAARLYAKAANAGNVDALVKLGTLYANGEGVKVDDKKAVSLWESARQRGSAEAYHILAWTYLYGYHGVKENHKKAERYFQTAAAKGELMAQLSLGRYYMRGEYFAKNYSKALKYLKMVDPKHGMANYYLGTMYKNGRGVPKSYAKALYYFKRSAKVGNCAADYVLSIMYKEGMGVAKNAAISKKYYNRARNRRGLSDADLKEGVKDFY